MYTKLILYASAILLAANAALAQSPASDAIPVTVDYFPRAESDLYFGGILKDSGAIGKFVHRREAARVDNQTVIRLNRDTLYSSAIFDLDAGSVAITLPDAGGRFMSMQVINEDHYVPEVVYGKGSYTLTKDEVGTRYVAVAIRTLVDPANEKDIEQVHALQDAIKVSQKNAGKFEVPNWDQVSQKKVRDALLVLATTIPDFKKAFGTKAQVDPIRHLIGTAAGWGGNPDKDAIYLNITPPKNDGTTIYKLNVKNVPVDAFWSVSLYDAEGYYEKNPYDAYSINNVTGKQGPDGSIAIQFGGCDGKIPNCLPIMKGWNYTVRLYRPRAEVLNGQWNFPERSLPQWRKPWQPSGGYSALSDVLGGGKDLILFGDTFNRVFERENLEAAERVLRLLGYRLHHVLPNDGGRPLCCGRTYLAAGQTGKARGEAVRTIETLLPYLQSGARIVGLEPSCILTFRDEFFSLAERQKVQHLARSAFLIEEVLADDLAAGRISLDATDQGGRVAHLHGHCHQKAFGVMGSVERLLRAVPGLDVRVIESSCCGMAGAFGYATETVDVSFKMGELSLFPALRSAAPDDLIVADGTSCRHQIHDGVDRQAMHAVRVLDEVLRSGA